MAHYKVNQNWDDMSWEVVDIKTGRLYTAGRTKEEAEAIAAQLNK